MLWFPVVTSSENLTTIAEASIVSVKMYSSTRVYKTQEAAIYLNQRKLFYILLVCAHNCKAKKIGTLSIAFPNQVLNLCTLHFKALWENTSVFCFTGFVKKYNILPFLKCREGERLCPQSSLSSEIALFSTRRATGRGGRDYSTSLSIVLKDDFSYGWAIILLCGSELPSALWASSHGKSKVLKLRIVLGIPKTFSTC